MLRDCEFIKRSILYYARLLVVTASAGARGALGKLVPRLIVNSSSSVESDDALNGRAFATTEEGLCVSPWYTHRGVRQHSSVRVTRPLPRLLNPKKKSKIDSLFVSLVYDKFYITHNVFGAVENTFSAY